MPFANTAAHPDGLQTMSAPTQAQPPSLVTFWQALRFGFWLGCVGWLMHGTRGVIAAGAQFVFPSWVLLIVLSWAYTVWGSHAQRQTLLWGLKPAVTTLL